MGYVQIIKVWELECVRQKDVSNSGSGFFILLNLLVRHLRARSRLRRNIVGLRNVVFFVGECVRLCLQDGSGIRPSIFS